MSFGSVKDFLVTSADKLIFFSFSAFDKKLFTIVCI